MFMSFGQSLEYGEIEGFEIYKCSWKGRERLKMWHIHCSSLQSLKFSLTDPFSLTEKGVRLLILLSPRFVTYQYAT